MPAESLVKQDRRTDVPAQVERSRLNYDVDSESDAESEHSNRSRSRRETHYPSGPTKVQLSARQFLAKRLPIFSGCPEDWPLFISSYETANKACGFSNVENLVRLQESLKGQALEAVRSRLLLPDAVPQIIESLRLLYGRPEQLLNMLLAKVRKTEPPKSDRLTTYIGFGMIVQQLVDHLEATNLVDHLVNPMLIQELVEKLPASTKMEWVRYKRRMERVTLRTLSDFLSELVRDASEATLYGNDHSQLEKHLKKEKEKVKAREGFINAHGEPEDDDQRPLIETRSRKPCKICSRLDHRVRNCAEFRKLNLAMRWEAVRKWKLCKNCLNEHGDARCRHSFRYNVGSCSEPHNPLLHPEEAHADCNVHRFLQQPVIFRMVPVTLYNGKYAVNTIAFLDEGSSYTLVEQALVKQLKINGVVQPLRVTWTAGVSRVEKYSQKLNLMISAQNSEQRFRIEDAHTVEELKLPKQTLSFATAANQYMHLRDLPVVDYKQGVPRILIGLKDLHLYAPLETRIGRPNEPIAVKSKLGWTVYGPVREHVSKESFMGHHTCNGLSNQELHDVLKRYYSSEETGIAVALVPESAEDQRARQILNSTTVRIGDRFETGLLWKEDEPMFPDSYAMALRRMKGLEKRFLKDEHLFNRVQNMIADYVMKGYAHKATFQELQEYNNSSKVWYLPLGIVVNPKKPEKLRLVWDAAAVVNGVSLNSHLLKGPDMLTSLPSVICRFREREVGFGGDIKEMYHQLRIRKEDRQAQRFLFRTDFNSRPEVYVMDVATFGSSCSPCSAQFVKNKNAEEFATRYLGASKAIVDNHYVDDYFDSTDTVNEAIKRAKDVRYIHSRGGFEIRNWVASSNKVLQSLGELKSEPKVHFHQDKHSGTERVLGIVWNTASDEFCFSSKLRDELMIFLTGERRPTKRTVLRCVMSIFDPLGLLAPFTVYGKMLIQDLWRTGCDWDDEISDELMIKWKNWIGQLSEIEEIKIPRYHFMKGQNVDYNCLQLHVFVDASSNAYGCVAYFRVLVAGHPVCSLVMAKSKVAPLKMLTIPRLELQGAVLGSRLMNTIIETHTLPVKQRFLWTDSRTVLSWIHSDQRKYKQFVAFRIGEILALTNPCEWRWLPTRNNIADDVTKWQAGRQFNSDAQWFRGPIMINNAEDTWAWAAHLFHDVSTLEPIIDPLRISKWKVLVRTVACAYRFINNCRRKIKGLTIEAVPVSERVSKLAKKKYSLVIVPLKRDEYKKAESYLWRAAQADAYEGDVKILLKNRQLAYADWHRLEKDSELYDKSPFLDADDVIRMEGRTKDASFIPFELRCPIILPKGHPITTKLVEYYHHKMSHANTETVVNEMRQRFCIKHLRAELKRVVRSCVRCRIMKSKPLIPRMAPLPVQRITPYKRPFSFTGIDYFGPLSVTVGRRSEKRWIALFTCLTTRAIHLEVAHSLTTQACVMAIRRFTCRRGVPMEFFSDNGTNFKGASKEVFKRIDADCGEVFTDASTRWNFNPPSAPHMGGAWERLVRSVKTALEELEDGRKLTDEILLTTLAEAEDLVNSRPLTYLLLDSADSALTPNHFLRTSMMLDTLDLVGQSNQAEALRDSYKRSQYLADLIWKRWISEYMPTLNQRTKWHDDTDPIEEGDVVYVVDENHRKCWIRGIVTTVYKAKDGRIRQALVRTTKGELKRPVAKLAVLEVRERKSGLKSEPTPVLRGGVM